MPDLICEEISRRAGFAVSVGNWIAPDGTLICGTNYETHHWETIQKYFGEIKTDNQLEYMNEIIKNGFIRLVFRADVCLQVGASKIDELWSDQPNYKRMMTILAAISDKDGIDVHIFSKKFYVIGIAKNIVSNSQKELQIKVMV